MTPKTLQSARNLRNSVRNGRRKQNGWGWLKRLRLRSCLDVRPSWGWVEQLLAGSHDRARQHGMVVLGLAADPPARQALWTAELLRAEVFGAVERDQHTAAEPLKGAQPAMPAQHVQALVEGGLQVRGMHWVEHGADMIVGRHGRHAEQALAVRHLPPFLQRALVAEERLALHEEQREG